jgi:hypothetical protein
VEIWSLLAGGQGKAPSPLGLSDSEHEAQADDLAPVVLQCVHAVVRPLGDASLDFGRGATGRLLRIRAERVDHLLAVSLQGSILVFISAR